MQGSQRIAVYPGVFDPVTRGHLDVIARASGLFDRLIIAVGDSHAKSPFFSAEEREELVIRSLSEIPNIDKSRIHVSRFTGLLTNFAKQSGARVIIRGLRTVSDFDYEFQIVGVNKKLAPDLETVFLPSDQNSQFISSGLVKEIASGGGDLSLFVPQAVMDRFYEKSALKSA